MKILGWMIFYNGRLKQPYLIPPPLEWWLLKVLNLPIQRTANYAKHLKEILTRDGTSQSLGRIHPGLIGCLDLCGRCDCREKSPRTGVRTGARSHPFESHFVSLFYPSLLSIGGLAQLAWVRYWSGSGIDLFACPSTALPRAASRRCIHGIPPHGG